MKKLTVEKNAPGAPQKGISLCVPYLCGNEWKYVKDCLDTGWVSSVGAYVDRFEEMLANYVGGKSAVACVNGTSALHIALMVAGIRPDEEVLVPSITFVSPANCVKYLGAWPTFMDIEPDYLQIDPQKTIDFLTQECTYRGGKLRNRRTNRVVRAILPVHMLGHPSDMDPIVEIARKFNLIVIEDCAESLGASYKGRKTGSLADMACFSFNGNKIITAGGGGMIVTNNTRWAQKGKYLTTQAKDDPIEYIHNEIGFNYRLSNVQAAMGVAQMENLPGYVAAKRKIAERYAEALKEVAGIRVPQEAPWAESTFWLYTIFVDAKKYGRSNKELLKEMDENHIQARPLWHPLPRLKPFKDCYAYKVEVADRVYNDALSLPSSVNLTIEEQDTVIEVVRNCKVKGTNGSKKNIRKSGRSTLAASV